ncbi:unnamed protein product [[Candida] boidinii]|uniref:Unnamed protein product n=1 Tax=Candida boidinii TaxID=5477 RepID=A0ACB5TGL6_CANBO|nr:unnamed protein product [[Candida] boidinii]
MGNSNTTQLTAGWVDCGCTGGGYGLLSGRDCFIDTNKGKQQKKHGRAVAGSAGSPDAAGAAGAAGAGAGAANNAACPLHTRPPTLPSCSFHAQSSPFGKWVSLPVL